jgi:hypothetical protein
MLLLPGDFQARQLQIMHKEEHVIEDDGLVPCLLYAHTVQDWAPAQSAITLAKFLEPLCP